MFHFALVFSLSVDQRLCTVSFFFPMGRQSRYSGYKELMIRLVLASFQSALFVLPSHYGPTILTQARFIAEFRQAISAAGLPDASSFRGHSFRRGTASWAFNQGVPGELIQIYGDWASDAYKAYLEFCVESKPAFAHQLRFAVLSSAS